MMGQWTVVCDAPPQTLPSGRKVRRACCVCACGRVWSIRLSNIRSGQSTKCKACRAKASATHGLVRTSEWWALAKARQRCTNPKNKDWKNYGGRGIAVCEQWLGDDGYARFLADMGPKPGPKYSLDRINNDGDYEPGNCRWATWSEQQANRRPRGGR